MSIEDINNRFDYHKPDPEVKGPWHQDARDNAKKMAIWIENNVPEGREKSLALTGLEQVMFWCNAAIARHDTSHGK